MTEQNEPDTVLIGDYALATKWHDGDPCDHFFVGFVSGFIDDQPPRVIMVDNDGVNQRLNGFRRCEKITKSEGDALVALMPIIGDKCGPSVWWHLGKIRGEENPHDPCAIDEVL